MSGMIFGHGDDAWIQRNVMGKIGRNGSFVSIAFEISGIPHHIMLRASDIEKMAGITKHDEGFDVLVVLNEPATPATLERENEKRREDLQRKIHESRPR